MELYEKYKGRVNFVVVDLDLKRSPSQQGLVRQYYKGYIPQVVMLDAAGKPVYDSAGEVDSSTISALLDTALHQP